MSVGRFTAYNILGAAVPLALTLVVLPLYIHKIGPERYGVLAIAWVFLGSFGLFDLGLDTATAFRIAAQKNETPQARSDAFWSALAVSLALGLVGAAILWAAAYYFFSRVMVIDATLRPEVVRSVPILAASLPIATVTGVLTGALQARGKFLSANAASVLSSVLYQLVPLSIAYLLGPDIARLIAGALLARFVGLVILFANCFTEIAQRNQPRVVRSEVSALVSYGGWVTVASTISPILTWADRLAIGALINAGAVAIYAVPAQLTKQVAIVPGALTSALFPTLSGSGPEQQRRLSTTAVRTLSALLGPPILVATFFVGPFLILYLGPALGEPGGPIGRILLLGMWANALALVSYTQLQASGRPDLVSKVLALEVPLFLAALFAGVHFFGLIGAALAITGRNFLDWLLLTFVNGRRLEGVALSLANTAPLACAAWFAGFWPVADWRYWACFLVLAVLQACIALYTLPNEIAGRLVNALSGWSARTIASTHRLRPLKRPFAPRLDG